MSGGGNHRRESTFELTGGAACLDLVNTVNSRPGPSPEDLLESPEALIAWAEQAGLLGSGGAGRLREEAATRPRKAAAVLRRARELREALFTLFAGAADGRPHSRQALAVLNSMVPAALAGLKLAPAGPGFTWSRGPEGESLDGILGPVIEEACELLASEELGRVRRCESDRCDWLFIDSSRNRSRRWCDMSVCGNRAKARRHYARTRGSRGRNTSGRSPVST